MAKILMMTSFEIVNTGFFYNIQIARVESQTKKNALKTGKIGIAPVFVDIWWSTL
jgi:hypothetical protein